MKSLGKQLLIELYDCKPKLLNDVKAIENIMKEAAEYSRAKIIDAIFHRFNPHGVSGVIVIAESHLSIHTWPEYGFASADVYTCGNKVNPWRAYRYLIKKLKPKNSTAMELKRGVLNISSLKHKPGA
ncbi:MAG: adenosylmethionine decarboxylase [Elusimicrobia bacterium]|nr:adenosylmethionine decarboxylase [Elusimicrobiota bacterium]